MTTVDPTRLSRLTARLRAEVDAGRMPGFALGVDIADGPVLTEHHGLRDHEGGLPVEADTVFRLFSMTKAVTGVAAMALHERGLLDLRAPVAEFVPEFADTPVLRPGATDVADVVPRTVELRVQHLLTHTAGLTYGFVGAPDEPVARRYRELSVMDSAGRLDLAQACRQVAGVPLCFQPGTAWNYSVGLDVAGRVLEVITGRRLDAVLAETVLEPLGMTSTAYVTDTPERLARLYEPAPGGLHTVPDPARPDPPVLYMGGGGLLSTLADCRRFAAMLAFGGGPVLSSAGVRFLSANHLPGRADLGAFAAPGTEDGMAGLGFGLGLARVVDPAARGYLSRPGMVFWSGAAGTTFLADAAAGVSAVLLTQVRPPAESWRPLFQSMVAAASDGGA